MPQTKQLLEPNSFLLPIDFHLSEYHETRNHTSLGFYGEKYIHNRLQDSAYHAFNTSLEPACGDIRVQHKTTNQIYQVDVKTAFAQHNGRYGFCVRKENHTCIDDSDFAILLLIDHRLNHYVYVIPSEIIKTQFIRIASHPNKYSGKYSQFIQYGQICFDASLEVLKSW